MGEGNSFSLLVCPQGGRGDGIRYLPWPGPRYLPPRPRKKNSIVAYFINVIVLAKVRGKGYLKVPTPQVRTGEGLSQGYLTPLAKVPTPPPASQVRGKGYPKVPTSPSPARSGRLYASCVHAGGLSC